METIPTSQAQEKSPWEMSRSELSLFLKKAIPEELALINADASPEMEVFAGLVEPITHIAIGQISNPGLSWKDSSREGAAALRTHLNDVIPQLQESNPTMAETFNLVEQELLPLPGGDQKLMDKLALRLENLAWKSYSAGKPTLLLPQDDIWGGIICPGGKPSWDARALLMRPVSLEKQIEVQTWAKEVINLYQQKFPNLDLRKLEHIHLFVGENVAHAGTELASHTAGESLINGVMVDLNGCCPIEGSLTEPEVMSLYVRLMTAHELAHLAKKIALDDTHKELEEWMCDVLAWRAIAEYVGQNQFDADKQQELITVLETQTKLEFAVNGVANREDPTIRGYRASCLWFMEARKNNPDLNSWKARLDKIISTLWDPESEEAQLALKLEEINAII